ncbi:MAG TPA: type IV toxin-antitoxin system AbiEi family antitoxin domain-containing protein [Solirubrobacteraceae bacterium]|nr:type IV toxin-antitoxin system AbiEi family antitoxin domain-containing protein [Solirubrobacteraceae bacterium]
MGRNFAIDEEIAHIAAGQHGNVTRAQLRHLGLADVAIHHRVTLGRLHRVHRGVYAVGRPPSTPLERAAAAVLACGPRAALSHGSAMALWGFWQRWDEPFEVMLAVDRRPQGIRTHRCSTLLRRDVTTREGIRVTSAARTALDMAPRLRARSLTRLINDARRTRILTLEALADVAGRNPTHPGALLLKAHASNPHNPTRSGGEDDFLKFCARYGLPTPLINTIVHGYEVDAYFPEARLVVELDGWPYHSSRQSFEDDRERDATMLMHQVATIRITYDRFYADPDREASRLQTILEPRA